MYHHRVIKVYYDYRMILHREAHNAGVLESHTYVPFFFKQQTCSVLQNIAIAITLPYELLSYIFSTRSARTQ